jgi:hypothetical protein
MGRAGIKPLTPVNVTAMLYQKGCQGYTPKSSISPKKRESTDALEGDERMKLLKWKFNVGYSMFSWTGGKDLARQKQSRRAPQCGGYGGARQRVRWCCIRAGMEGCH